MINILNRYVGDKLFHPAGRDDRLTALHRGVGQYCSTSYTTIQYWNNFMSTYLQTCVMV